MRPQLRLVTVLFGAFLAAVAQVPAGRITVAVMPARTVALANTHPPQLAAETTTDLGAVPSGLALNRMLLVLRRPGQKELALEQYLDEAREPGSPNYHQWLTPAQFGALYGPDAADVSAVESWLTGSGFTINRVAAGGLAIEFSGTAGNVASALHTEMHKYVVNGITHLANATDQQIPAALAPVVAGVLSLDDFRKRGIDQTLINGPFTNQGARGQLNLQGSGGVIHAVAPADFYTIYDETPLLTSARGASGETVALVARSDVNLGDISEFRSLFLAPPNNSGTFTQIEDGTDPGVVTDGDDAEATLDAEWSTAAAPNAKIELVVSAPTDTTDGVDLSALYIVDHDLAPVMSTSFGNCEAGLGEAENAFWNQLWEQAAAEGITAFVSSGDNGPAACDDPNSAVATGGLAVNGLASTPWATAVGGTQFNENLTAGNYWNSVNGSGYGSALSYIPETAWGERIGNNGGAALWSSSGGASGLYAKPAWQSGTGVPSDGKRDVPDVSLAAASHDGYAVCFENSCPNELYIFGGTSASSPSFAGVMANVDAQQQGAQGSANPGLYQIAAGMASQLSTCSASSPPGAGCVFLDTTVGSNMVACTTGTAGCAAGTMGYSASVGYDLVTGLGSVNTTNLAISWKTIATKASATSLTFTPPPNLVHGQAAPFTAQVTAPGGGATPTGSVALLAEFSDGSTMLVQSFPLDASGTAQGTTALLPGGSYNLTARYSGDLIYGSSLSSSAAATVAPEASTTTLQASVIDANGHETPTGNQVPYGSDVYVKATVASTSGDGIPTGTVRFATTGLTSDVALDGEAQAAAPTSLYSQTTAGAMTINAGYSGDASFKASTAAPVSFTEVKANVTASVVPSGGTTSPPQLTLMVGTSAYLDLSPSGSVTFYNGTTAVGSATISGTSRDPNSATLRSMGTATINYGPVPSATIIAQYSGDSNYNAASSSAITVTTPPYVVFSPVSLDFGTVAIGTSKVLTDVMTNAGGTAMSGAPNPQTTGSITEANNCPAMGLAPQQSCTITFTFTPTSEGTSQWNFEPSPGGYAGGGELATRGLAPGFTIGGPNGSLDVTAGQSLTIPITLSAANGFSGPVTLTCSSMASATTCAGPPSSVSVPATGSVTANLTLTTKAQSASLLPGGMPEWWLLGCCGLGAMLLLAGGVRRRGVGRILVPGGLALMLLVGAGCGGGGGGGGGGGVQSSPASPGPVLSPGALNFGLVEIGQSAAQTVTLSNQGTASFIVASAAISDNRDFVAGGCNLQTLGPGASCPIQVTFSPRLASAESGTLSLLYGSNVGSGMVPLTGTGGYSYTPPGSYSVEITAVSGAETETSTITVNVH